MTASATPTAGQRPRLVLVGAGHVHVMLLWRHPTLVAHYDITLVAPHAPRLGGAALAAVLAGGRDRQSLRLALPVGPRWHKTRALALRAVHRRLWLMDGNSLSYDALCLNIGCARLPAWADARDSDTPRVWSGHSSHQMQRFAGILDTASDSLRLVIAGAGRAALELAGALAAHPARHHVAVLCCDREPVSRVLREARRALVHRDVAIIPATEAAGLTREAVVSADGRRFAADHLIWVGPSRPSLFVQASGLAGSACGIRVDRHLERPGDGEVPVHAAGACATLHGSAVLPGWDAAGQADVLASRLMRSAVDSTGVTRYRPPRRDLVIRPAPDALLASRFWTGGRERRACRTIDAGFDALTNPSMAEARRL